MSLSQGIPEVVRLLLSEMRPPMTMVDLSGTVTSVLISWVRMAGISLPLISVFAPRVLKATTNNSLVRIETTYGGPGNASNRILHQLGHSDEVKHEHR